MREDVCVIIPAYNEGRAVGDVIKETKKYFPRIVCVDDGSADNSAEEAKKAGAIVLQHAVNVGAGAATQTGVEYGLRNKKCKYFVTLDADGQHEPKNAIDLVEHLKKNDLDIVLGSRFMGEVKNISPIKRRFLQLAAQFSGRVSGVQLTDPHIGLRAFNRHFAENMKLTIPGYAHASELVDRIAEGKYRYGEFPVTVHYSDYSKAKGQPMLNAINITFDLFIHRLMKK